MENRLRITGGPHEKMSFELTDNATVSIGRHPQHNEIVLRDPNLSRVHCQVEVAENGVVLSDFDSETGTFVNGQRLTAKRELQHGDVVKIGDTELCFEAISGGKPVIRSPATGAAATPVAVPPSAGAASPGQPSFSTEGLIELAETTLGHFEIGPVVGKGHGGLVFRARDRKADRLIALKVLHPGFPKTEEEIQRFGKAMKSVLPLRHPNLVTIFGAGKTGPYCWIAMELVEGESLAEVLGKIPTTGIPDWSLAFRVAVHVARALHFAAQSNLIHRNITPPNILLRVTDNLVKLGDLMLAKALAGSALRQVIQREKTLNDRVFYSPEQTNPSGTLDVRSDIYSLGVVLYALLTGHLPFSGKSSMEIIANIRDKEPHRPTEIRGNIPEVFEDAVLKMMAKRPEDRFQTTTDLLQALAKLAPDPW